MKTPSSTVPPRRPSLDLVPRLRDQGYDLDQQAERRRWLEETAGCRLEAIGRHALDGEAMRGNVENPIGAAQMPLGVAGPLEIHGEAARGTFYVPLATTEGALVRSYERGMAAITRAGGAITRVWRDENRMAPVFTLPEDGDAPVFVAALEEHLDEIRAVAEATTRHGRLLGLEARPAGRRVIVVFRFSTGDAHGMNMIASATDAACRWIVEHSEATRYLLFSGWSSEKRPSGNLLDGGKGKRVTAAVELPRRVVRSVLRATPEELADLWRQTVLGHFEAGSLGYNGHYANGLTALFVATGQDVANVVNSAVGVTNLEMTTEGGLAASVLLPSLTVATVGGGTGLATSRECLDLLGCSGTGKAVKLAEIAAATVLAGELSMAAAIATGEFVSAHETLGRNRPGKGRADGDP